MSKTIGRLYKVLPELDKALGHAAVAQGTNKSALVNQILGEWRDRQPPSVRTFIDNYKEAEAVQ